jgi:hypothetical protein
MEILNRMIAKVMEGGQLTSHLLFADDTIILWEVEIRQLQAILLVLLCSGVFFFFFFFFEGDLSESELATVGEAEGVADWVEILWCKVGSSFVICVFEK